MSFHTRGIRNPPWKPPSTRGRKVRTRPDPGQEHWRKFIRKKESESEDHKAQE